MWYEIIPSAILASLVTVGPPFAIYHLNQLVFGNPMRRNLAAVWDRQMCTRDIRIDGAPWKNRGLANVPDD